MMPWAIFAVMTVVALAIVLVPLLRARKETPERASFDLAVYRDQLAEADRDAERGLLSAEEAEAAKAEIGRRMLRAADEAERARPTGGTRWAAVGLIAVIVPATAFGLYALVGAPNVPDMPYAARTDTSPVPAEAQRFMERAVAELKKRIDENPHQLAAWVLLARTYMTMRRYDDAAEAYRHAVALARGRADVSADYGEALVAAAGGTVTEPARAAFDKALEADPFNTKSFYYLGLERAQNDDARSALQAWIDLMSISPPDAPWRATVQKNISRLSSESGIDTADITPMLEPKTDADRERLRGLTGRLADRLKQYPGDEQGWRTLARSYRVLDETEKADEATTMADALAENRRLKDERRQRSQIEQMSPEQRKQVRGMVQRLADRLAEEPDDLEGWRMLARSYRVLGETDKAKEADARAAALAKQK
jgi:cytochrome c-type biogenesis protein CcmH